MELAIVSVNKKDTGKITLSEANFGKEYNEGLVHQVVTAYLAAARSGNSAQKTRSEVSGGGKKPWRQKGTGRARAGTIRSPIWRHGGVTFAAKPRNYAQKVNKKMYRTAMKSILSELIRQDRLVVVDDIVVEKPKTRELIAVLNKINLQSSSALIILDVIDTNLMLAARNIPHVTVATVNEVNPVNLISHEKVIITVSALKKIEETLHD